MGPQDRIDDRDGRREGLRSGRLGGGRGAACRGAGVLGGRLGVGALLPCLPLAWALGLPLLLGGLQTGWFADLCLHVGADL